MSTSILSTPSGASFLEMVESAESELVMVSPFWSNTIAKEIIKVKRKSVHLKVITSWRIENLASKATDPNAIQHLLENGSLVSAHSSVHSKMYIFDYKSVLITSANATYSGMYKNKEIGIVCDDQNIVKESVEHYNLLKKESWDVELIDLESIKSSLESIRAKSRLELSSNGDIVQKSLKNIIGNDLSGWKKLVYDQIIHLESDFSLSDLYTSEFMYKAKSKYPSNNNIEPKVRQQLQYLRDLGIISFKGEGRYERLI
jgi:hypothetical protein